MAGVAIRTIVAASTMADTRARATMPGSSGGDLAGAKLPDGGNIDSWEIAVNVPAKVGTLVSVPFRAAVGGSEERGLVGSRINSEPHLLSPSLPYSSSVLLTALSGSYQMSRSPVC